MNKKGKNKYIYIYDKSNRLKVVKIIIEIPLKDFSIWYHQGVK